MPVTSYHTVGGRIRGESAGGARTDYVSDALGSVTGTVAPSGAAANRYRHKPYGHPLLRSGSAPDPMFLWAGETGSRYQGATASGAEQHNRARHYATGPAVWTSLDPLWPDEPPYGYVGGNPTTRTDPSGMKPCQSGDCPRKRPAKPHFAPKSTIRALIFAEVATLYPNQNPATLNKIVSFILCIAQGESEGFDINNISGKAFGLFQLGTREFDACAPKSCRCKYFVAECQVKAAVNLMGYFCATKRKGLYGSLQDYFGSLPRPNGNPSQVSDVFPCLKKAGFDVTVYYRRPKSKSGPYGKDVPLDILALPCPAAPRGCQDNPSAGDESGFG